MKKHIALIIFLLSIMDCELSFAATIPTPNGNSVTVYYKPEEYNSPLLIQQKNQYWQDMYPNATLIGDSSTTYNCHGYAWAMTEGEATCWIEQVDLSPFWTDYSYFVTTSQYAEKVYYDPYCNHSAVVSATISGMYESKWETGPLMRHTLYDCPYYRSDLYNYTFTYLAKAPKVSGLDIVLGTQQGTYSLSYSPLNAICTWDYDSDLFNLVSSNNSQITLSPKTLSTSGGTYVTANFEDSSGNTVNSSDIYVVVGSPDLVVRRSSDGVEVYPALVGLSPNTYYYAYLSGYERYSEITWSPDSHIQVLSSSNSQMYFKTDSYGYCLLNIYGKATPSGTSKLILGATLYSTITMNKIKEELMNNGEEESEDETDA